MTGKESLKYPKSANMSELFLHIGSHKTGTTSIQKACRLYLANSGSPELWYINIRPAGTRVVRSNGRLEQFRAEIIQENADQVFRPEVDGRTPSGPIRFIASDEEFFWISEPETVQRLAKMLKDRFSSISIVCYLRRQDLLAVSHRKQVLGGRMPASRFYGVDTSPLPKYRDHLHRYFDYAEKLSSIWAAAFGQKNIQVIPYERDMLIDGDVVKDFAQRTGGQFQMPKEMRSNAALDGDRTMVGLKLAELKVPKALRRRIMDALPGTGRYQPSRDEARFFLDHFAESNERLAREWTWQGAPFRFEGSFDMYPETTQERWSNTEVEGILDAVLRSSLSARR